MKDKDLSLLMNPISKIVEEKVTRSVIIIDGAHDVFTENIEQLENILVDFCRIKPPGKFYIMTSIKQSFGMQKLLQGKLTQQSPS
mmetsp:Transcript_46451/g.34119  ORF Transcript_46451/g.34119 Transcript_46451/m.34119 type:complete len:85 (+) Transcript_46451:793-1047(+)